MQLTSNGSHYESSTSQKWDNSHAPHPIDEPIIYKARQGSNFPSQVTKYIHFTPFNLVVPGKKPVMIIGFNCMAMCYVATMFASKQTHSANYVVVTYSTCSMVIWQCTGPGNTCMVFSCCSCYWDERLLHNKTKKHATNLRCFRKKRRNLQLALLQQQMNRCAIWFSFYPLLR